MCEQKIPLNKLATSRRESSFFRLAILNNFVAHIEHYKI